MVYILLLLIIVIILMLLLFKCCSSNRVTEPPPSDTTSTTENKTLDFIPAEGKGNGTITIPGYAGIIFQHGTLNQKTDLHNPEKNNCLFVISLYLSNDTLIYKSDHIKPGETLDEITLLQTLEQGIYKNCKLVYNCYSLDGKTHFNGSSQTIEINSK